MAVTYMTEDGLKKLKEELHELETVERPRVIAAIAEAREKGDLSENAEYDAAKEAQGALETKIAQLKLRLMDARVLDATDIKTDEVQILTKVRVKQRNNGQEKTFQLVTEGEANLAEGKISVTTPIAKGLMGKKVGEIAQVQVPAGIIEFEVLEITLFDLTDEQLKSLMTFAKKVAKGVKAATGCKRVGVAVLGMEVNHVHVHLIPMNSEKDMLWSNPKLSLPAEEMAFIANSIAEAVEKA